MLRPPSIACDQLHARRTTKRFLRREEDRTQSVWDPSLLDMNSESRCESMCDYLSDSDDEYLSMVVVEPTRRSKNLGAFVCEGTGTMLEKAILHATDSFGTCC